MGNIITINRPLLLGLITLLLSACGSADGDNTLPPCLGPLTSGLHECGLVSGEYNRYYQLRVPASYTGEAIPLVLDLHGYGSPVVYGLSGERLVSGIDNVAKNHGFAVAWPQGIKNAWNSKPSKDRLEGEIDDVSFLLELVTEIKASVNIDSARVYIMGISNGGAMSQVMACEAADVFAAVSSVAFQIPMDPMDCTPSAPMPMISFHALTDSLVPYDGTLEGLPNSGLSAPDSYEAWSDINGCTDESKEYFSQGNSVCEMRQRCDDGVSVAFCTIDGEGHFLGGHLTYFNNDNVNLSPMIWDLFSQYTR